MNKARKLRAFRIGWRIGAPAVWLLIVGWAGSAEARADCLAGPSADAAANAASLHALAWTPFRRPEVGWEIYEPLVAREIATECPPQSPGFAAALARWKQAHKLQGGGVLDAATFAAMAQAWELRRPFVVASQKSCPDPPPPSSLAAARPDEVWGGKPQTLRADALAAYRGMVKAARAETPVIASDRRLLQIFSAFRSPDADAERCAKEQNCQGVTRATCSAHRTGLAVDLYLGAAPGKAVESSDDDNRRFIARGAAYRWMVGNAERFGFVNYPFEPWHWEWTPPAAQQARLR